ncbi:hypothetical protein RCL1_004716 [Eukaryota sp. TZLM3-RCL]
MKFRYGTIQDPVIVSNLVKLKRKRSTILIVIARLLALLFSAFLIAVFVHKLLTIRSHKPHVIIDNFMFTFFGSLFTAVLFRHVAIGSLLFCCLSMYGLAGSILSYFKVRGESDFWFITVTFSFFFTAILPLSVSILAFITFRLRRHIEYLTNCFMQLEPPSNFSYASETDLDLDLD